MATQFEKMENFKAHLDKFIKINDEEFASIFSYFQVLEVKKKENLMLEGEVCKFKYFVLQGCLRKFFVNEKRSRADHRIRHRKLVDCR